MSNKEIKEHIEKLLNELNTIEEWEVEPRLRNELHFIKDNLEDE